MAGKHEDLCPDEVAPLHEARRPTLLAELVADMQERGWQGRDLLVIETESAYQAWTGSHRIAAAREVGLKTIPCYVIQEKKLLKHGMDAVSGHVCDYERLAIMRKVGDETAIHLMWLEGRD